MTESGYAATPTGTRQPDTHLPSRLRDPKVNRGRGRPKSLRRVGAAPIRRETGEVAHPWKDTSWCLIQSKLLTDDSRLTLGAVARGLAKPIHRVCLGRSFWMQGSGSAPLIGCLVCAGAEASSAALAKDDAPCPGAEQGQCADPAGESDPGGLAGELGWRRSRR
jgi:hypothetical protein